MRRSVLNLAVSAFIIVVLTSCATVSKKDGVAIKKEDDNIRPYQLVGIWKNENMSYTFDKDGYATITMGMQTIGGAGKFKDSSLKYEIDYTQTPMTLDLVHFDTKNNRVRNRMAMIVKFITKDKIQVKTFNNDTYPEKFEENDQYSLFFVRAGEESGEGVVNTSSTNPSH